MRSTRSSRSWSSSPELAAAVAAHSRRETPGIDDVARYCREQNGDASHRELVGPVLAATGASGVVLAGDAEVATWGEPDAVEMLFSATKSVLSAVAGVAYDDGLIDPHAGVVDGAHPALASAAASGITWHQLLQQTSGWDGELWGKPASGDAQSGGSAGGAPGTRWAYNDVRVNLLCLALTTVFGRPLGSATCSESASWGRSAHPRPGRGTATRAPRP